MAVVEEGTLIGGAVATTADILLLLATNKRGSQIERVIGVCRQGTYAAALRYGTLLCALRFASCELSFGFWGKRRESCLRAERLSFQKPLLIKFLLLITTSSLSQ